MQVRTATEAGLSCPPEIWSSGNVRILPFRLGFHPVSLRQDANDVFGSVLIGLHLGPPRGGL